MLQAAREAPDSLAEEDLNEEAKSCKDQTVCACAQPAQACESKVEQQPGKDQVDCVCVQAAQQEAPDSLAEEDLNEEERLEAARSNAVRPCLAVNVLHLAITGCAAALLLLLLLLMRRDSGCMHACNQQHAAVVGVRVLLCKRLPGLFGVSIPAELGP